MGKDKKAVYQNLKYRIVTQELSPGQRLSEKELMEHYGIGRTPMRDILMVLERDGLVQRFARSGTFVAPMDINELRRVTEIRICLEGLAGQLAATRISDEELLELREVIEEAKKIKDSDDVESLLKRDTQFHQIIYDAADNERLKHMLTELQSIGSRFWYSLVSRRNMFDNQLNEQCAILEALERRDPEESKRLLQEHLHNFIENMRMELF